MLFTIIDSFTPANNFKLEFGFQRIEKRKEPRDLTTRTISKNIINVQSWQHWLQKGVNR